MSGPSDRKITSAQKALQRWQGTHSLVRELMVSHRRMRLVLYRDPLTLLEQNLVVTVPGPVWMSGPFEWDLSSVNVAKAEVGRCPEALRRRNGSAYYRIYDERAEFELFAITFQVHENLRMKH